MIAKITTGNSVEGMVYYNHNKENEKKKGNNDGDNQTNNQKKSMFLGAENINGDTHLDIIKSIKERNERNNGRVDKPNIHISLNFNQDENLTNNEIYKIGLRYMELMKYSDQPFAIYRHFDTKHPHIHIVSTQIDLNGKKISDSYIKYNSMTYSRQIEKEFNLKTLEEVKRNNRTIPSDLSDVKSYAKYVGYSIRESLLKKPTSFFELDLLLSEFDIKREVGEKSHFFQIDKENSGILKVKDLDHNYTVDSFEKIFENNKNEKQIMKKNIMGRIYSVINSLQNPLDVEDLEVLFKKKGISITFGQIESGELKGTINKIFFRDIKSGLKYSASDVGVKTKDFISKFINYNKETNLNTSQALQKKIVNGHLNDLHVVNNYHSDDVVKNIGDTLNYTLSLLNETKHANEQEDLRKKKKRRKRKR